MTATQFSNRLLKTNPKLSKREAGVLAFLVSLTMLAIKAVLFMVLVGMLSHYGILHATLSYPQSLLVVFMLNMIFRSSVVKPK